MLCSIASEAFGVNVHFLQEYSTNTTGTSTVLCKTMHQRSPEIERDRENTEAKEARHPYKSHTQKQHLSIQLGGPVYPLHKLSLQFAKPKSKNTLDQ